jgi:hypothetical protein
MLFDAVDLRDRAVPFRSWPDFIRTLGVYGASIESLACRQSGVPSLASQPEDTYRRLVSHCANYTRIMTSLIHSGCLGGDAGLVADRIIRWIL